MAKRTMANRARFKNLTTGAPRSPRVRLGGFVILARAVDKCRATIAKKAGEYHFNCELDKRFLSFKGISAEDLKKFVAADATDADIADWVKKKGLPKNDEEISVWSNALELFNYADDPEGKKWLDGKIKQLGLPVDATLFDYLDADDKASFPGAI